MIRFLKNLNNDPNQGINLSILLLLGLLLAPLAIDDAKYILVALFLSAYFIWQKIGSSEILNIRWSYINYLLAFSLVALISVLWADDASQALRHGFLWVVYTLIACMIAMQSTSNDRFERQVAKLFSIFFVILLLLHLGALQFDISLDRSWNNFLSKGKNYTTTLLTVLVPFLLFYPSRSQFVRFSKIISIILLANILFLTGARGALLAFAFIVVIKLWNFYAHSRWRVLGGISGLAVIIAGIYLLNTSEATTDFTFVNEYRQELASRIRMNKNSMKSIRQHPFIGVGAGHWARDIYQHGIGDVAPLNNARKITRLHSHNAYFKIAVEYGLIGWLLFFTPLLLLLLYYRDSWTEIDGIKKAAWVSLVAWLIVMFFYATAVPYSYFFSGIALVGMVSAGLLLPQSEGGGKRYVMILIILSLLCALWFSFTKVCHATYQKANRTYKKGQLVEAQRMYDKLYHPIFFASADYQQSVDLRMAEFAIEQEDFLAAKNYFERGLKKMPNSTELMYRYLTFLEEHEKESTVIDALRAKLKVIQPNLVD